LSMDINHLVALKAIRAQRENRMSRLRGQRARQYEQLEQRMMQTTRHVELLEQVIKRRSDMRWRSLFEGKFDSAGLLLASMQDKADAERVTQAQGYVRQLMQELREAKAQWDEASDNHAKALRKLETSSELVKEESSQRARRDALRVEAAQDDAHGVRYAS